MHERTALQSTTEVITFYVEDVLCGIDVLEIQEINRINAVTPVPLAPDSVRGIINLRGEIVTIIDLATRLGITRQGAAGGIAGRNIIVRFEGERIGLVVDRVGDVVAVTPQDMVPAPGNIQGIGGKRFKGVIRHRSDLIAVLDVGQVLR